MGEITRLNLSWTLLFFGLFLGLFWGRSELLPTAAGGADMPLGSHVAAWATLSQADNVPSGENTLYLMGVSANF